MIYFSDLENARINIELQFKVNTEYQEEYGNVFSQKFRELKEMFEANVSIPEIKLHLLFV